MLSLHPLELLRYISLDNYTSKRGLCHRHLVSNTDPWLRATIYLPWCLQTRNASFDWVLRKWDTAQKDQVVVFQTKMWGLGHDPFAHLQGYLKNPKITCPPSHLVKISHIHITPLFSVLTLVHLFNFIQFLSIKTLLVWTCPVLSPLQYLIHELY